MDGEVDARSMEGEVVDPEPPLEDTQPRTLDPYPERQAVDPETGVRNYLDCLRPRSARSTAATAEEILSPENRRLIGRSESSRRRMRRLKRESEGAFDSRLDPEAEFDAFGRSGGGGGE